MPKIMDVIEFFDETGNILAHRFPSKEEDAEIKWGAQLTVRESQTAVFFRDGKALDVFEPGRYMLRTKNLPLLTKTITSLGYGTKSPFRAEIYFCNMKLFKSLHWGTRERIPFRDSELQMVRLGARGVYSIKIADPQIFINKVVGTMKEFKFIEDIKEDINDYLIEMIVSRFQNVLGELITTVYDLPKIYDKLSVATKSRLKDDFDIWGLDLADLFIVAISLPEEVEKRIDEKTGMNAIKNMNDYFQYNAAQALKEVAKAGGVAGSGMGLGAGIGMGMKIAEELKTSNKKSQDSQNSQDGDPYTQIERLKQLLDKGAITKEEFEAKKKQLLDKI